MNGLLVGKVFLLLAIILSLQSFSPFGGKEKYLYKEDCNLDIGDTISTYFICCDNLAVWNPSHRSRDQRLVEITFSTEQIVA